MSSDSLDRGYGLGQGEPSAFDATDDLRELNGTGGPCCAELRIYGGGPGDLLPGEI